MYGSLSAESDLGGIVAESSGDLWFTDNNNPGEIGKMTTSGTITKYPLKAFKGGASDDPQKIIVGPDGNLWFTEYAAGKVGKITTSGTITEYSLPEKDSVIRQRSRLVRIKICGSLGGSIICGV